MKIETIKQELKDSIFQTIYYYEVISSTQEQARKIVNSITTPTVILADRQTKGKGTKNRSWYTGNKDNIAMTIMIKPNCHIRQLEGFTVKIAQAIKQAINQLYGYCLEIKDPNDLLLEGKKIAGILTETNTIQETVHQLLIGIGFNVNEVVFSEETKEIATSLKKQYYHTFQKEDIIIQIIKNVESLIKELK